MVRLMVSSIEANLESSDIKNFLLRPSTWNDILELSDKTMGRAVRLCGLTGVIIKLSDLGYTNGPPQLREYPVEPVGV